MGIITFITGYTLTNSQKTQTFWLPFITVLAIAHICAVLALIGLVLFSSIVQEMGQGVIGVIIVCLTFITLIVNAALLVQARQKIKAQHPIQARTVLITAGGIFLAYNLAATILNTAFLRNLIISTAVISLTFVAIRQMGRATHKR